MMRSMYSGVSGLRNHQTRMDVIGNNIANVNTPGYKKSRVVFKDAIYQATRGASAPTADSGGTNPMAVGLGMTIGSIDQLHTPAPTTTTNKTTDMAINGNGYFIVNNGNQSYYTRAGSFDFNKAGNLFDTSSGYLVQGWNADANNNYAITPTGDTKAINIAGYKDMKAKTTANSAMSGNLDSALNFQASRNEVQTLTFPTIPNGGAQGGTFTLTLDGKTTGLIQVGANGTTTASNIQAALEALSNVGTGNVSVSWDQVRGQYDITFQGALAATNMKPITFATPTSTETSKGGGGSNEKQTLSLAGATGGTFKLTYGASTTALITIDPTSAANTAGNIQTALNTVLSALVPGPPAGHATVTNVAGTDNYTVVFDAGAGVANTDVNLLTFAAVTGGNGALTTSTEGQTPLSILPINEVQTLDLTGATAGSCTLTYGGAGSVTINYGDNAGTIQSKLEGAYSALNGNITVTQVSATNGGRYNISFTGNLAGKNIDQMTINAGGLTGTGTVSTTTQGQPAGSPLAANCITTSKEVYDSQGNPVTMYYRFFKYEIVPGTNPGVTPVKQPVTRWACDVSTDALFENQSGFNANKHLRALDITGATAPSALTGDEKITRVYNINFDENGNIIDPTNANFTYNINRQIPPPGSGTSNLAVKIDMQKLSQYQASSSARVESQDGYAAGKMTSYTIGTDGTIRGVYDNGESRNLARVALRNFENPAGLQQMGGTMFSETPNSGGLAIGAAGQNGLGTIIPSSLEMSNVDLSEEFTDMIVTQRGFQANSRIITTSDEMLQELVSLKR